VDGGGEAGGKRPVLVLSESDRPVPSATSRMTGYGLQDFLGQPLLLARSNHASNSIRCNLQRVHLHRPAKCSSSPPIVLNSSLEHWGIELPEPVPVTSSRTLVSVRAAFERMQGDIYRRIPADYNSCDSIAAPQFRPLSCRRYGHHQLIDWSSGMSQSHWAHRRRSTQLLVAVVLGMAALALVLVPGIVGSSGAVAHAAATKQVSVQLLTPTPPHAAATKPPKEGSRCLLPGGGYGTIVGGACVATNFGDTPPSRGVPLWAILLATGLLLLSAFAVSARLVRRRGSHT
jgi:hypothetical protein